MQTEIEILPSSQNQSTELTVSPGFRSQDRSLGVAREIKFLMTEEKAEAILERAGSELSRDPHGELSSGQYDVCSLYLDSPNYEVLYRRSAASTAKFRLRRYDRASELFIERKVRERGIVSKQRHRLSLEHFDRSLRDECLFLEELLQRQLLPSCCVQYRRHAFYNPELDNNFRVTVDSNLHVFVFKERTWQDSLRFLNHPDDYVTSKQTDRSKLLFENWFVVEFKYMNTMPVRLKDWIAQFQLVPMKFSKYRTAMVGFDGD
jgi:hypothetical protein